jgi:RNA polymerase sigma-70 factor (ECF subfamily)
MKDVNPAMSTTLPLRRPVEHAPSFAAAAEQHLDDVYRYLLVLTRDPTLAEDLAGETFERALRTWRRFDPRRASARTWLCLIARSAALDHFRSEQRRTRREEAVAEREHVVDAPELGLSPELERGLSSLSAADREVIALRIVLDLDSRSAANLLGVSESACTTRLNRALKRLEEEMTSDDE